MNKPIPEYGNALNIRQKPRIYIAIDTFLPLVGGAEKQAFLQSKYLREQGFEVTIITMRYRQEWPRENLDEVPVLRVAGHVLCWYERMPGVGRQLCYLLALLVMGWQLWRHRSDYNILHVFQLTLFTLPALLVCRLAHKGLVIAMRCEAPEPQTGRQNHGRRRRTGADLEALEHLGGLALRWINRQLRLTRAYLTILSTRMYINLKRCGLTGAEEIVLIPNGVDSERFKPHAWTWQESLTVVCVAKLRYQKGLDILLRSWRALLKELPEAKLIVAGDGPLLIPLQRLADDLGIASSVDFAGLCSDVAEQYQRGHIAVLPSRWEGMPNALLEAMSCGLACVATRVSGSEDLLCKDRYGLLVEPEDAEGLTSALLRLLKDPELARYYGRAARQHIEQYYTFQHIMDRYIELYRKIIVEQWQME